MRHAASQTAIAMADSMYGDWAALFVSDEAAVQRSRLDREQSIRDTVADVDARGDGDRLLGVIRALVEASRDQSFGDQLDGGVETMLSNDIWVLLFETFRTVLTVIVERTDTNLLVSMCGVLYPDGWPASTSAQNIQSALDDGLLQDTAWVRDVANRPPPPPVAEAA